MSEDRIKTEEGATLWRRFGESRGSAPDAGEAPDALLLAAYLDGGMSEEEAARLEARLAADPALLGEVLALRETLAAGPEAAPATVVARARTLRSAQKNTPGPAMAPAGASQPGLLDRIFGAWLRPAVPALASLAVVLACAGAFELGRYQSTQLETAEVAESAESEVPVDLLLEGLL